MQLRLRIVSYFAVPTDLAEGMRSWPEFVDGHGYDVELRHVDGKEEEAVSVKSHLDYDEPHLLIFSSSPGALYERVAGRVVSMLSSGSDYLMVSRHKIEPIQPPQPTAVNRRG